MTPAMRSFLDAALTYEESVFDDARARVTAEALLKAALLWARSADAARYRAVPDVESIREAFIVGAVVEWIDALNNVRRAEVYRVDPDGRVHVSERVTNRRGPRRTRSVPGYFDANELDRLRVVSSPSSPPPPEAP